MARKAEDGGMRGVAMAIVGATALWAGYIVGPEVFTSAPHYEPFCVFWFFATLIVIAGGW